MMVGSPAAVYSSLEMVATAGLIHAVVAVSIISII
jgi:hypothetical protein